MLADWHGNQPKDSTQRNRCGRSISSATKPECKDTSTARGLVVVVPWTGVSVGHRTGVGWGPGGCPNPSTTHAEVGGRQVPRRNLPRFLRRQHPAARAAPHDTTAKGEISAPRCGASCTSPPTPPAPRHGQAQLPAPGSPVLGTRASPAAGMGGRASAGKRAPRAVGRPAEPSQAGNGGHTSCHRRLGSAPAPPVPAPAPGEGLAPSLPLCPSLGPLLAQSSPACVSRAFPTLCLAGLGLSCKPGTAGSGTRGPHGAALGTHTSPWS